MKRVMQVNDIQLFLEKSNPPKLVISATGLVSSSGWTEARLQTVIKGLNPDGYMELEMVARPPDGIVMQVILPICADAIFDPAPTGCKGAIVHAASNFVTRLL
ncbi:hypothetical protein [Megalodesulfovibrio paquesii]